MTATSPIIQFKLPQQLACPLPTELRGIRRDAARLMVSRQDGDDIQHATFAQIGDFLQKDDVLVVNTSATQAAALPLKLPDGSPGRLHLSTAISNGRWLVEIRAIKAQKTTRWKAGIPGLRFDLTGGGSLRLIKRYYQQQTQLDLWEAKIDLPLSTPQYLGKYGLPIKYQGVDNSYPLSYYQTYFAHTPGSSEMPSAGRGFTAELVNKLLNKGIHFAPILLHTGVSSLEADEMPYPEYAEVSALSANIINSARERGGRVIAVGTTAVRALESAAQTDGQLRAFSAPTDLFIGHDYEPKIVDGLITGFHEPEASHLHMLQAIASEQHLAKAYHNAIAKAYYWHEFGDFHLLL